MASLKQIASEVGVSYTLVSKVLNDRLGTTGVSPKTRQAILKKAKELDYVPNRLAVALKAGRKGAIGIFLHHVGSPGSDLNERLLHGVADGLEKSNIRMWLRFFNTDEQFHAACDIRLKNEVDGLIVIGASHPGLIEKFNTLQRENVPVVSVFNDYLEQIEQVITNVSVNYKTQGYLAARHLLDQGCRSLACFDTHESRTAGFFKAHRDFGLEPNPHLLIPVEKFLEQNGVEGFLKLQALNIPFDGIVCASDAQAAGAINTMFQYNIKVPETIRITGVDNSPIANNCIVPITSVTSETRHAGLKAVELLLRKIEGHIVRSASIEPKLHIRKSCGTQKAA
ncbi:MAG: LacI family DNA-binding transcriptional regulator [Chthoniobacterales bacterium]